MELTNFKNNLIFDTDSEKQDFLEFQNYFLKPIYQKRPYFHIQMRNNLVQ